MTRTATKPDFSKPTPLSDAAVAFGSAGDCVARLMPPMASIPENFKRDDNPFVRLQREWFFKGLRGGWPLKAKPGIDHATALRHLAAIQQSFEPQHEHKKAAVAYLMSLWFEAPKPKTGHKGKPLE